MRRVPRPLPPVALGAVGLAATLATAAVTLGERDEALASYGAASPGIAVIELVAAAALFAAAALLATDARRERAALCTVLLGAAWSAAVWAGWAETPSRLRSLAILLVPTVAPLALLTVVTLVGRVRGRRAALALGASALASGVVLWLVRDPFLDLYCWRDCTADTAAPLTDIHWARTMTDVTLGLAVLCGAALAVLAVLGLLDRSPARRAERWALVPAAALGCALSATGAVLLTEPAEDPERTLYLGLFTARALGLTCFAAGLAMVALRPRLARGAIARLARESGRPAGGGLRDALAEALGEPELRIGYPLEAQERVVDAEGRPADLGAEPVSIVRGDEVVALVGTATGTPPASALDRELGPAARLALANERLRAEQLARLHEVVEVRRRIVATGDATRRQLERDLHDGAQQRMLALSFDLRVALSRAEAEGNAQVADALRDAFALVSEATADLRAIAHGIFPAVLTASGLAAALETLADSSPLALTWRVAAEHRYPRDVEAAAYAVVAGAMSGARELVHVAVTERAGDLVVEIDGAPWSGGTVSVEDRVGAVGGDVRWEGDRLEAALPLPCD